jgi:hypothetical protein
VSFDKLGQVSWIVDELFGLIVNDVRGDIVKETGVVGYDETSHILLCFEPIFEPSNGAPIEL